MRRLGNSVKQILHGSNDETRGWPAACSQGPRTLSKLAALLVCCALSGCAALTNPVKSGVPVERVPSEWLAPSREGEEPVPLSALRQPPQADYRLSGGDVLGVWIEGVLDEQHQLPPLRTPEKTLRLPERSDLLPAVGYPILVRQDGTLPLPQVKPVNVQGMTIGEAEEAIRQAYTVKTKVLQPGKERLLVTLMRPRLYQVVVFRQDAPAVGNTVNNSLFVTNVGVFNSGSELLGSNTAGTGQVIDLPAYENDLLHALALTGGLPGSSAASEVVIYRTTQSSEAPGKREHTVLRVPLRWRPAGKLMLKPEDVILETGDVVYVQARPVETFYTAGLLPSGEHVLPRDYDLDVVEAVARVRGPMVNGAFGGNNLSGTLIEPGIGNPNPSLLTVVRRRPDGGQIPIRVNLNRALRCPQERLVLQSGDVLILQETPCEAVTRYFTDVYTFSFIGNIIHSKHTQGNISVLLP